MTIILIITHLICIALGAGICYLTLRVGGKLKQQKEPGPQKKYICIDERHLHPVVFRAEYEIDEELCRYLIPDILSEEWVKKYLRDKIADKMCDEIDIEYYTSWHHPGIVFARTKFYIERK